MCLSLALSIFSKIKMLAQSQYKPCVCAVSIAQQVIRIELYPSRTSVFLTISIHSNMKANLGLKLQTIIKRK